MHTTPDSRAGRKWSRHAPAANTAAVVTLAVSADERHVINAVYFSYDAAPTGGKLTITVAGTTKMEIDIVAAGPGAVYFPVGLYGNKNEAVVITLAAGGAGATGKLNVQYQ